MLTEALRQLQAYRTVATICLANENGRQTEATVPWIDLLSTIDGDRPSEVRRLGMPTESRFHYPVDKRRTTENHEAMQLAEQNLDAFRAQVDKNMEVKRQSKLDHLKESLDRYNPGANADIRKLLTQPRNLQRTGDWVEPNVEPVKVKEIDRRALSELYFDLECRTEKTIARSESHSHSRSNDRPGALSSMKAKTSGAAKPQGTFNLPPPTATSPSARPDVQPTFDLDARALKVFRTIFFTPSTTSTSGEVAWLDFLHAMAATGFAPEKLYGSVWNFSPALLNVERSIQFHEPHPSGKIPYRTARRHGRRLERAYGWHGGMFRLVEKKPMNRLVETQAGRNGD